MYQDIPLVCVINITELQTNQRRTRYGFLITIDLYGIDA